LVLPPSATQQGFAHRTRWRQYADVPTMEAHKQARITEFGELARQLGTPAMLRLEFSPQATDEEIVQALWSSPLRDLFPSSLPAAPLRAQKNFHTLGAKNRQNLRTWVLETFANLRGQRHKSVGIALPLLLSLLLRLCAARVATAPPELAYPPRSGGVRFNLYRQRTMLKGAGSSKQPLWFVLGKKEKVVFRRRVLLCLISSRLTHCLQA